MGANQIDRYGNQNLSAFGPLQHPNRQMFGVRGAPGNTINHATSYWVGNHSKRVFCDAVDIVSGIGWDKVDPGNPAFRFTNVFRVVSNLGVFDFGGPGHTMRAVSLQVVPTAILSRQTAGIRGASLIVNLPGKPSAIADCLTAVLPAIPYCVDLIGGARLEVGGGLAAFRPKNA